MKIHIKNGRLIDPRNGIDAHKDVYVAAGKIVAIGDAPKGFTANRTIDATGLIVCPGLVDLAARLREPGFEYMATLESEMEAAIAGGVTSLACPPDTDPPLDEPGLVEMLKFRAKNLNQAHVYPIGALTQALKGMQLTEMAELVDAGCVAFSQADAVISRQSGAAVRVAVRRDVRLQRVAAPAGCDAGAKRCSARRPGRHPARAGGDPGLRGNHRAVHHPAACARDRSASVHLCRLSSAEGVDMVRQAKRLGIPVTCDVAVHHVHLSEMDIGYFDPNCHLTPPLRSGRDRDALRQALADGTIDAICSDHAPVDEDVKQLPFAEAEIGATGLELLLPLTLKWAEESGVALSAALAKITSDAARILAHRRRPPVHRERRRYLRLRSRALLESRARRLEKPGQKHALPRPRTQRPGAADAGRGPDRLRSEIAAAISLNP